MVDERAASSAEPKRGRGRPRLDDKMVPAILDAAENLFARREALSVTIREIAEEAGVPHSAIYRYFDSKDDVLQQVLERGRDRQIRHEAETRVSSPKPESGAIDWMMANNQAYMLAVTRAALAGATGTSLAVARHGRDGSADDRPARAGHRSVQGPQRLRAESNRGSGHGAHPWLDLRGGVDPRCNGVAGPGHQ